MVYICGCELSLCLIGDTMISFPTSAAIIMSLVAMTVSSGGTENIPEKLLAQVKIIITVIIITMSNY